VGEIPDILGLERQCATAGHWTREQYEQSIHPTGELFGRLLLIAHVEDPIRIVGFLAARHLPPEWELENVVVSPSVRQQGVGKRLMEDLLARARKVNSAAVFLEVRESNRAARGLYEKAGFIQVGRRKNYYKDPLEDATLYRLDFH
jgi:ribosomal-protein-alanine N-acetyltransferase